MPSGDLAMTSGTGAIERAVRAIVYIAVDWSMPERLARPVVRAAVGSVADLGLEFFVVKEGGPVTVPWLISRGWTRHSRGYGSLMWFERGRLVATELLPGRLGAAGVVRKTRELWGRPAA
jgi:hypothetical protein